MSDLLAQGRRLVDGERYREALERLAEIAGDDPVAAMLSGVAASRLGELSVAAEHFARAGTLDPTQSAAFLNLGLTCRAMGRDREAEAAFRRGLDTEPESLQLNLGLAGVLIARGDHDAAAERYEKVIASEPGNAGALNNLGLCRKLRGRAEDAARCFEAVLEHEPGNAAALANLGAVRAEQGRTDAAIALYRKALDGDPANLEAANNLGVALLDKGRAGEAAALLRPLAEDGRAGPETLANLGNALAKLGDTAGARVAYDAALTARPDGGLRLRRAMLLPVVEESRVAMEDAYVGLVRELDVLAADPPAIDDPFAEVGVTAFNLSYHDANNRPVAEKLADLYLVASPSLAFTAPHCRTAEPGERVRIGFVSRHFQTNSVGRCFHGVLRFPGRDDVEVTAFTFTPGRDPLWQAIAGDVDRAVVLPPKLGAAREAIAAAALDILVYTDIGMEPLTYFLSFARLAPVQCVLGGHPDAAGVPNLDYYVSCDLQEPPDAAGHYRARLVRLPGAPTWYERPELPSPLKSRSDLGLPGKGTLYFCGQTLIKVHPDMDPLFREILLRDTGGTLVLPEGYTPELADLLRRRLEQTMPDVADRVRFLPAVSHMDFMNVMALADVSLDTRPFGGGNTSWQAIAAGTPMVSWPGAFLRGRYTQALYRLIGIEDAIAGSAEAYVEIAHRLGTDADARAAFNARVAARADEIFADRRHVDALYDFLVNAARGATPEPG